MRLFSGIVFESCIPRMIRNVRHSTSVQSFYLCCHSVWADVPDCGWNCQLAAGVNGPIPCSLAIIVGHLLDNDVAGRCAGGPPNSICILSSDEWRVGCTAQSECPLWVKSGHRIRSASCPLYPRKRTLLSAIAMSALCQKRTHAVQQKQPIRSPHRRWKECPAARRGQAPLRS
jgi:hypothetical protein